MKRVVLSLLLAATLPLPSFAQASFAQEWDDSQLQAAAVRALRWAFYAPSGYRWEYSGILVSRDGELVRSIAPRTLKMVDAVEMDADKLRSPGDTLVGLYHTHPCKPDEYYPQYFSPQDLVSAFFYHVPTFMLDECTGQVHEFDPNHDRAFDTGIVVPVMRKDGSRRWLRLPAGRVVGYIGDQGPDLTELERLSRPVSDPSG
jgi:proteasome lid subunit RPN8/RPN11